MTKSKFFEMLRGAQAEPRLITTEDRTTQGPDRPKYTAIVLCWKNSLYSSTLKVVKGEPSQNEVNKYACWLIEYQAKNAK